VLSVAGFSLFLLLFPLGFGLLPEVFLAPVYPRVCEDGDMREQQPTVKRECASLCNTPLCTGFIGLSALLLSHPGINSGAHSHTRESTTVHILTPWEQGRTLHTMGAGEDSSHPDQQRCTSLTTLINNGAHLSTLRYSREEYHTRVNLSGD